MALVSYTKSYSDKINPLPIRTPLYDGESLTSWIVRAGLNQGCDYGAILYYHWSQQYALLQCDFDKGFNAIDPKINEGLAILARTSLEEINQHTLITQTQAMGNEIKPNNKLKWVVPVIKTSKDKMTPYPFCHLCLREGKTAYLKYKWRYSWYVYCDVHKIAMSETCFNCDLPYQPFRIKVPNGHLNHCPHCDFELSHALTNLLVVDEAYEFQKNAEKVLSTNQCIIFNQTCDSKQWFELMLFYINLVRKSLLSNKKTNQHYRLLVRLGMETDGIPLVKPKTGLDFDLLPRHERIMLMAYATRLSKIPLEKWLSVCKELKLSQSAFKLGKKPIIPVAFNPIFEKLIDKTVGNTKPIAKTPLKPKSVKAVTVSWERMKTKIAKLETYAKIKTDNKARKTT